MSQFIQDMIHLTEGEKLIKYWWLWLPFIVLGNAVLLWQLRREKRGK